MSPDVPDPADRARELLAALARRQLDDGAIGGDPALLAAGWERRSVLDPARADELASLYRELGFEARTEPILPDRLGDRCAGCQALILAGFRMLYTRDPRGRRPGAPGG